MVVYASDKIKNREDAYALLSRCAGEIWGLSPLPALERSADGKPYFPGFPNHHFNLSHSEPFALCALDTSPVGADIQRIRCDLRPGLPRRVCAPEELVWLDGQNDRWRAFALLWALKEARLKYTGTGLRAGIRTTSVPLPQLGQSLYLHEALWFRVYAGEDWMAAVCGEHVPPEELIWT